MSAEDTYGFSCHAAKNPAFSDSAAWYASAPDRPLYVPLKAVAAFYPDKLLPNGHTNRTFQDLQRS